MKLLIALLRFSGGHFSRAVKMFSYKAERNIFLAIETLKTVAQNIYRQMS